MFSYFNSAKNIIEALPALSTFLRDADSYFAHLPKSNRPQHKETLEEHINLVNKYLLKLIEVHQLDRVINSLIVEFNDSKDENSANYLKRLFVNTIVFHDFGKINEQFQFEKMKNQLFAERLHANSPIGSTHAALGAYIYLTKHLNEIGLEYKFNSKLVTACIYLSYSIFKHHGSRFSDDSLSTINFADFQAKFNFEEVSKYLSNYLDYFGFTLNPQVLQLIGRIEWLKNQQRLITDNSFSLYALCRLNFSLLTASDYLATNEYMNDSKIDNFGTLSKERIDEIYKHVSTDEWINEAENKHNYNKSVFEKSDDYQLQHPTFASGDNLYILRTEMGIEVLRNIRKNANKNLFYIEAPTGGGKTNLSALATIELLKLHEGNFNKVFYVFPFTTLITQTYKALKDTLGLADNEMVELHSNAGIKIRKNEEDDLYGNEKLNYIHHLFVNYPFVFLSHIRFFDILKTNEKETNYLLHRLANSVVVIDELQSYNPEHWDKMIYFVGQYAKQFNIKFILMSATLPKLDKLNVIKNNVQDFVYLLPEAKKNYFNNSNFAGRVVFNFELFDKKNLQLRELKEKLLSISESYSTKDFGEAKPKDSVYAIIEFIFKKTASEFYGLFENDNFFDEIFLLSGTILPHRRKYIINFLKNKYNRKKKVLLITTQVVEAGVDIDMDIGFKDRSLIDSDEQLAGRINRNVVKEDCTLFLFNYNKEAIIYGKDKRLELTRKHINAEVYREILANKDFDKLYNIVLNDRNLWNEKDFAVNFSSYEGLVNSLKYQSVHDQFKLIDQNNISCFIPLNVPLKIDATIKGQKEEVFTQAEIDFLKSYGVTPNDDNEIEGKKVFDIYMSLVQNSEERKKQDFIKNKTKDKTIQGVISKFIFSLFETETTKEKLVEYSDVEKSQFGYQYIEYWRNFYDVNTGMRDTDFNSNETQFL